MNGPELVGYTALEVSVDVAGILTAIASMVVALVAHRRVTKLARCIRAARAIERSQPTPVDVRRPK